MSYFNVIMCVRVFICKIFNKILNVIKILLGVINLLILYNNAVRRIKCYLKFNLWKMLFLGKCFFWEIHEHKYHLVVLKLNKIHSY